MSFPNQLHFSCGVAVSNPLDRLKLFLSEEYEYYDAIPDSAPNQILPIDVLVAAGINAFIGRPGVARMRKVHRGLVTHCEALLADLPQDVPLATLTDLSPVVEIIACACSAETVLSAVATKVLHRKRRNLIPILDFVMVANCGSRSLANVLSESYVSRTRLERALNTYLEIVRNDVQHAHLNLLALRHEVAAEGTPLTELRIHDILIWTEKEPSGYYRRVQ